MAKQKKIATLTDRDISDRLMQHYGLAWRLDPADPNRTVYLWNKEEKTWMVGKRAENDVLRLLGEIFAGEESHAKFNLDKTMLFMTSQILDDMATPPRELPPYVIVFKNCLLPAKNWVDETPLHYSTLYPAFEPVEKKPTWLWRNEIPHDYDPKATCPKWLEFIAQVHHPEDIGFDQEWWGYHLHRSRPKSIFTILHGSGSNGKTVEQRVIKRTLGAHNYTEVSIHELNNSPWGPASLHQKLANISDDIPNFQLKSLGELRKATGDSGMHGQFKFGQPFDFEPYAKITYACNELPEFKEDVEANWDRLRVLRYDRRFSDKPEEIANGALPARDREELVEDLCTEITGIINWLLEAYRRLLQNGFRFSYSWSTQQTRIYYRNNANSTLAFKESCLVYTGDEQDYIKKVELPSLYRMWCRQNKIKKIKSDSDLFKLLGDEGMESSQPRWMKDRQRVYIGWKVDISTMAQRHNPPVTPSQVCCLNNYNTDIETACAAVPEPGAGIPSSDSDARRNAVTPSGSTSGLNEPEVPPECLCSDCVFWKGTPGITEMAFCIELRKSTSAYYGCSRGQKRRAPE